MRNPDKIYINRLPIGVNEDIEAELGLSFDEWMSGKIGKFRVMRTVYQYAKGLTLEEARAVDSEIVINAIRIDETDTGADTVEGDDGTAVAAPPDPT